MSMIELIVGYVFGGDLKGYIAVLKYRFKDAMLKRIEKTILCVP